MPTQITYGTATAFTVTMTKASSTTVGRESSVVDNTSTKALDYLITGSIVYPNSAPANDQAFYFWVAANDGTNWTGAPAAAGAGDADYTFASAPVGTTPTATPLRFLGAATMIQNKTVNFGAWSIAAAFGGWVPSKFVVVYLNYSGQTATSGTLTYQAIGF